MVQITPEEVMERRRRSLPRVGPPCRRIKSDRSKSPRKWSVYRIYNEADELLYVGMTCQGGYRLRAHINKPWAREMRDITVEEHPTKQSAATAERLAIAVERPKYNVAHAIRSADE